MIPILRPRKAVTTPEPSSIFIEATFGGVGVMPSLLASIPATVFLPRTSKKVRANQDKAEVSEAPL